MVYATEDELRVHLDGTPVPMPPDSTRLLQVAADRVDATVTTRYDVDGDKLPTDPTVAAALRDAQLAQVEYLLTVGEDVDLVDYVGPTSLAGLSVTHPPAGVAPRAVRILRLAGLLNEPRVI